MNLCVSHASVCEPSLDLPCERARHRQHVRPAPLAAIDRDVLDVAAPPRLRSRSARNLHLALVNLSVYRFGHEQLAAVAVEWHLVAAIRRNPRVDGQCLVADQVDGRRCPVQAASVAAVAVAVERQAVGVQVGGGLHGLAVGADAVRADAVAVLVTEVIQLVSARVL